MLFVCLIRWWNKEHQRGKGKKKRIGACAERGCDLEQWMFEKGKKRGNSERENIKEREGQKDEFERRHAVCHSHSLPARIRKQCPSPRL